MWNDDEIHDFESERCNHCGDCLGGDTDVMLHGELMCWECAKRKTGVLLEPAPPLQLAGLSEVARLRGAS